MYIKPLLCVNRAISASLLFPEHYLQAIATSEIISVISPFLNQELYLDDLDDSTSFILQLWIQISSKIAMNKLLREEDKLDYSKSKSTFRVR